MISGLVKYLQRFSYPQVEYIAAIKPHIDQADKAVLIDAPCGGGATSWLLSAMPNLEVLGYDINEENIGSAKNNFSRNNLHFDVSDIHNVITKHAGMQYFCVINSLFLLPEPDKILENIKGALKQDGKLFIVLPNIHTDGFKWFQKNFPEVNKLTIADSEFDSYFSSRGWIIQRITPIAYARYFNRTDVKYFSVFAPLYLRLLNYIQTIFTIGKPNYFMLALCKSNR